MARTILRCAACVASSSDAVSRSSVMCQLKPWYRLAAVTRQRSLLLATAMASCRSAAWINSPFGRLLGDANEPVALFRNGRHRGLVAVADRTGPYRGQVAARLGLGEPLAPDVITAQCLRQPTSLLLIGAFRISSRWRSRCIARSCPFVLRHPSLYRIGFQRVVPSMQVTKEMRDARGGAILRMQERVQRLKDAQLLGSKTLLQAVIEFGAMCEGLANIELRKNLGVMPEGTEESVWRAAIG